jgi:hypothetical protein
LPQALGPRSPPHRRRPGRRATRRRRCGGGKPSRRWRPWRGGQCRRCRESDAEKTGLRMQIKRSF